MADWKTARFDPDYVEPIDPEIVQLCDALNAARFVTTSSCCGHGHDWPRVWFEHSTDARIEAMARYVLAAEAVGDRAHFTKFEKEVQLEGYAWGLEIHLSNVYGDTPTGEGLAKAVKALAFVTDAINSWAGTEDKAG